MVHERLVEERSSHQLQVKENAMNSFLWLFLIEPVGKFQSSTPSPCDELHASKL